MLIDGHVALCPITIPYLDGSMARLNDPLPLRGHKVRAWLILDPTSMAQEIGATLPPILTCLPPSLCSETDTRLQYVSDFTERVPKHFYVRIVDKGVGAMWGFCRRWVCGALKRFLADEGHTPAPGKPASAASSIRAHIMHSWWELNKAGQLATLYLIGKAKS